MKNKTCVKVGEDGNAITSPGLAKSAGNGSIKCSRVPLYRVVLDRTGSLVKEGPAFVTQASEAARLFREFIGEAPVEHFVLMVLDSRRKAIGLSEVSVGTLSASLVHPRDVFKAAILLNGAALIVCHNHPSGDPSPSSEDREVTRRLQRAGELIGIPLADHIIIGDTQSGGSGFFSFREHGIL